MSRGPVWTPMTGPIVPTVTSASGTTGSSIATNSSTSGAFACRTLISSTLPAGIWSTRMTAGVGWVRNAIAQSTSDDECTSMSGSTTMVHFG